MKSAVVCSGSASLAGRAIPAAFSSSTRARARAVLLAPVLSTPTARSRNDSTPIIVLVEQAVREAERAFVASMGLP